MAKVKTIQRNTVVSVEREQKVNLLIYMNMKNLNVAKFHFVPTDIKT